MFIEETLLMGIVEAYSEGCMLGRQGHRHARQKYKNLYS